MSLVCVLPSPRDDADSTTWPCARFPFRFTQRRSHPSLVPALQNLLADNARRVHERVAEATLRAGRELSAVRVIAVTKYVSAETAAALFDVGEHALGENRVQELEVKAEALLERAPQWHLIGSLQTNKVARALSIANCIHSVDRVALWDLLAERAAHIAVAARPRLLLQVNTSAEANKHGFSPSELRRFFEERSTAMAQQEIQPAGLMTMAALHGGASAATACFETLAQLSEQLRAQGAPLGNELSMGMSQDFEMALRAGATMLRIGSAFFEGLS